METKQLLGGLIIMDELKYDNWKYNLATL